MKLQEKRKAAGLSQSQLAEKSGVPVRSIQEYEQGKKDLKKAAYQTVQALSDALGCKTEDFFQL